MGIEDNKKTVFDFIGALNSGDLEAVGAAFADDATWWLPAGDFPLAGTYKGKKAILEDFLGQAVPLFVPDTLAIEVRHAIAEGDYVAVEWIARGKSARGGDYENHYHVKFEIKEGKIQSVREYVATIYAKQVLFG